MYATAQKGVKILGSLMQQVRIEMKRIVRLGLHLFTVNRQSCDRN